MKLSSEIDTQMGFCLRNGINNGLLMIINQPLYGRL
jgi:hypothetical protein